MRSKTDFYRLFFEQLARRGFDVKRSQSSDYIADIYFKSQLVAYFSKADTVIQNPFVTVKDKLIRLINDTAQNTANKAGICRDCPYTDANEKLPNGSYKLAEYNGVTLACKEHHLFGYVFSTYRTAPDSGEMMARQIFYNKEFAGQDFAKRSGLVDERALFTEEELRVLHAGLVTGETMEDALDELTEALSEDGMQRYVVKAPVYEQPATQREKAPEPDEIIPYRWNARNIRIAVAGSQRRSGVTVTAFNLASWLAARGAEVAYIEVNQNRHLQLLLNIYEAAPDGEHYTIDGIDCYLTNEPDKAYPIDFWGFLRTANKPKKLEWREYKEVYPNLPFFLPSKATERKIIIKKDSLTILGSVFTPPFTLSQLTEKLGSARIVLQNGTRKSPITGRESPYTQEPSALRICSKKAFVVQIPLFCKRLGGSFTRMNSCHVWRPVGALMKKEH